jgi:hypothetical protein
VLPVRFPDMSSSKLHLAAGLMFGLSLASVTIGPATAETEYWATPPQNNLAGCVGRGSAGDFGAPLEVQVRDRYGPYRGEQVVMVSEMSGQPVVTLACNGPADQFRLRPGAYRVVAFVPGAVRSPEVVVNVPASGTSVSLTMNDEPNQTFDNID